MDNRFKHLSILIIDDEPHYVELISRTLNDLGYRNVHGCVSPQEALSFARERQADIVFADYRLPGVSGLELIRRLQPSFADSYFILITAYAELQTSIEALRMQLFDLLQKPFGPQDIELALQRVRKHMELKDSNRLLQGLLSTEQGALSLLGRSEAIAEVREKVALFARHFEPVLITGATGVGKELVAQLLHAQGQRKKHRFVAVNCSAFPDTLLESELFGHEKGAFTGADSRRVGKLEYVNRGTIMLDEVCEIPPHIQVKLLRVLQEKEFERLGGNEVVHLSARVVSATNKNLEEAIEKKWLRQDFYYRLNRLHIHVPPLCERGEDIEYLARHFLRQSALMHNKPVTAISSEAMTVFLEHPWPGNVRQLQGVMDYAVICCERDEIGVEHLPRTFIEEIRQGSLAGRVKGEASFRSMDIRRDVVTYEREMILEALEQNRWNRSQAAKSLGYTRMQLYYRMKKYGI